LVVEREALTCLVKLKRHGAFWGPAFAGWLTFCVRRWRVLDGALATRRPSGASDPSTGLSGS